ncbi:MAG: hypothetical protein ABIR98_03625 [Usitatibacter sp.]
MKEKIRYTDEPMQVGRVLRDFLPPPGELVFKEDSVKVTISLSATSIRFFKAEATKVGVQYQRMIRRVLDAYVEAFEPAAPGKPLDGPSHRVEQARSPYRKTAKRRAGSA